MIWAAPVLLVLCGLASVWLSTRSQDPDAQTFAGALVLYWLAANVAWCFDAMVLLPAMDWTLGVMALTVWWSRRARWVAYLVQCLAARLVLHVLDYLTGHVFFVAYAHALNATYAVMLALVAFPGGWHGHRFFDSVLHRIRGIRGVVSAPTRAGLK